MLTLVRVTAAAFVLSLVTSAQTFWHVDDDNCPGPGSGSAPDPFCRIQDALAAAARGDTVLVGPGTYLENVVMKAGVDLLGSGAATTTIDAGGSGTTVVGADDAILDGFLITGASGLNEYAIDLTNGSSPTISNNVLAGNEAVGIAMLRSKAVIVGNRITGNPTCPWCNPIRAVQSGATISRNRIDGSDPNGNLSAIEVSYIDSGMPDSFLIDRNFILGRVFFSQVTSINPVSNVTRGNVIMNTNGFSETMNLASSEDAGLIVNNTLIGGGGILAQGNTGVTIENNIIAFGNTGIDWFSSSAGWVITANDVFGNTANYGNLPDQTGLNGNISADPLFVEGDGDDLRLQRGSPCVDAGSASASPLALDIADVPRVLDGDLDGSMVVDMGAHEFSNIVLTAGGNLTPGGQLTVRATGTPGSLSFLVIGDLNRLPLLAQPWGALHVALPFATEVTQLGPLPASTSFAIPEALLVPADYVAQAIAFGAPLSSGFAPGNFSNTVTIRIR